MMEEIWKIINNTNNMFSISNLGKIRNNKTGKTLKTQKNKKGYHIVRVTVNQRKTTFRIHRLVAECFVPNVDNKPQVNHKDGNKDNNKSTNLEWVSNKENCLHAIKNGLWVNVFNASKLANEKRKTPILAKNVVTGKIYKFDSICDAEKALGTKHINAVIKGERSQAKGYVFSYYKGGGVPNEVIYNKEARTIYQ